jgi:TPP-dependent pyruvate/acetoin dehydrogenase alpha subunit
MTCDLWSLYRKMLFSRLYEEAVTELWNEGLISGEMHLGTGEEAIIAGVVDHLGEGDAMALDHRGTAALLMRGTDPVLLMRELLGREDGLCAGCGGHMHLFSPEHFAASSGIVGASGPAGIGFALAAHYLRPGTIAVSFFGEGAMNQGMLMESMNLAVVWKLPVLFVCKDDSWAITTRSEETRGGDLISRAESFGMSATEIDGSNVEIVWNAASSAIGKIRAGEGPSFIHAHCTHLEEHFLGYQLLRLIRQPVKQGKKLTVPLLKSAARRKGATVRERVNSIMDITSLVASIFMGKVSKKAEPIRKTRQKLENDKIRLEKIERSVIKELEEILKKALNKD